MQIFFNVVCSLLAVGGVVAAASPQQEVQHRLRGGGVPAASSSTTTTTTTTTKNAEERRLGPGETGPSGGVGVGFLTLADAKAECVELGTLVCGSVVCYNMITSLENCESRGTADLIDDSDWQSPGSTDSGDASDVATDMNATATEDSNVTNSGASDSADASASASADTTTAAAAAASSGDCTSITAASATFTTGTLKTIIPWSYRPESVTAVTDGYLVGSMSPGCDDGKPIDPHSQCGGVHKVTLDGQLDTSFANITGLSMVRGVYAPNSETLLVASQTDGGTVSRYILNATGATLVKHISVGSLPPSGTAPAPNCICMNDDNTKAYVTIPGWNAKTWLPSGTGSGLAEIDMATDTASVLFWNESSVFPNGCDVEDDMVYLGNFNYPLATYNTTTRMIDTSIAWASGLGFPAGQGMTDNVIADGIVAYNGDLFVGMAKLAFPDDSAPTGTGNLWRCEGVLTGTVDSAACKEIAILPVADMQLDENGPALIIPSLFGHEVKSMCIDTGCSGASSLADTTTTTASASSGDCASITDTVCAMEGVTVFCELLKNPKRRNLGLMDTNSTSTDTDEDEDTDADADANMSSPTGASASGSSDGDGTEDFASAFGFEDESEDFTLFVPTDAAFALIADKFELLSDAEAGRVIMFHMYSGMLLTSDKLACSETITSMNEMSDASRTKCKNDGKKYQNGNGNTKTGSMPEIDTADHMACNGVIHTLDHVMFPVSLSQLHADA